MLDKWGGRTARRYAEYVAKVVRSPGAFDRFRADRRYRRVVETVEAADAPALFASLAGGPLADLVLASEYADTVGGPRTVLLDGRRIAPTTVRYAVTLSEILSLFPHFLDCRSLCEIGVGYGGLARLICEYHRREGGAMERYRMFDLPDALELARRYIEHFDLPPRFEYRTKSEVGLRDRETYDFLISNWAFSEFGRDLQSEYLDKVVMRAAAGYLVMNTGLDGSREGYGGRACLSDADIIARLPGARVVADPPPTPRGYVIVFGLTGAVTERSA